MTPEEKQRARSVVAYLLQLDSSERSAFIDEACGENVAFRAEVQALLDQQTNATRVLDLPVAPAGDLYPEQIIGRYKVIEKIGEGGMGVVYKARDLRLGRLVALKVLPPGMISDPDRKRRFLREAKAASALNYPNIVTVYDLIHEGGMDLIVMEYVSGSTLAQLVGDTGLSTKEALGYAIQIADALEKAHSIGIIHRDLKPANIIVTTNEVVKILDFGIAKLSDRTPSSDPGITQASPFPQQRTISTIAGTPAYMAPEQILGGSADARSDIFSFTAMLYEMISGYRLFDQGNVPGSAETQKKIKGLASPIPPRLVSALLRGVQPNPALRWQSMLELKNELTSIFNELSVIGSAGKAVAEESPHPEVRRHNRVIRRVLLPAAAIVLLALLGIWLLRTSPRPTSSSVDPPRRLTFDPGVSQDPAISLDGRLIAYASDRAGNGDLDIWIRDVQAGEPARRTNDPADESSPAFSPDGRQIAFRSERDGGGIYVLPAIGGEPQLLVKYGRRPRFSPDGRRLVYWVGEPPYAIGREVYVLTLDSGESVRLAPGFSDLLYPIWSDDGKSVLLVGMKDDQYDWWVVPLDHGMPINTRANDLFKSRGLFEGLPEPHVWLSGRVLFSATRNNVLSLWQIPLSPASLPVKELPRNLTSGAGGEEQVSVDAQHDLVFARPERRVNIYRLTFGSSVPGRQPVLSQITNEDANDRAPSLSARGDRLVYLSHRTGENRVWMKDLISGREWALPSSSPNQRFPRLAPDGSKVAYAPDERRVFVVPSTGGRTMEVCNDCKRPSGWSPDGVWLLYSASGGIARLNVETRQKSLLITSNRYPTPGDAAFSADGRWIAFHVQIEKTRRQIFVVPFHDREVKESEWIPITDGKGDDRNPVWSPTDNMLYFLSEREGRWHIFSQQLDPASKHPRRSAVDLFGKSDTEQPYLNGDPADLGLSAANGIVVFAGARKTASLYLTKLPDR